MDHESSSNCCSTRVVEKLNLAMLLHPIPYKLHCLNEDGDFIVKNQVKIQFSIENYNDEVLCDIVPMNNCHILLGRSWHFERQTIHKGLSKKITLYQKKKKFIFHPLTPTQVVADQVQMKINRERDQKEKEEKEIRDKEEEERKEYDRALREKREKIEFEKMAKEEEEILLKKGLLLTTPPTPTIILDSKILRGFFESFNSSHFINHSLFFNPLTTFAEFFNPIFLPIVLNSSKDFEKSYFELMLPKRFELTSTHFFL